VRDLLVITPSRGRAARLAEMLTACKWLSRASTDYAVAVDEDQALLYEPVRRTPPGTGAEWFTGPRDTLTGWTNRIAKLRAHRYRAVASFGDDHLPRTEGWDALLLAAIDAMGGTGIAYGNDGIFNERLPTAPVITSDIVQALGWMCLPACRHMAVDLAWKDLGLGAGCLVHVPEVTIEHVHWCNGKTAVDAVYAEAEAGKDADRAAYFAWKDGGGLADAVDTVRALRKGRHAAALP
jgi:hypothetical protein